MIHKIWPAFHMIFREGLKSIVMDGAFMTKALL